MQHGSALGPVDQTLYSKYTRTGWMQFVMTAYRDPNIVPQHPMGDKERFKAVLKWAGPEYRRRGLAKVDPRTGQVRPQKPYVPKDKRIAEKATKMAQTRTLRRLRRDARKSQNLAPGTPLFVDPSQMTRKQYMPNVVKTADRLAEYYLNTATRANDYQTKNFQTSTPRTPYYSPNTPSTPMQRMVRTPVQTPVYQEDMRQYQSPVQQGLPLQDVMIEEEIN